MTGAASGIGAACAARLARDGYRVIGVDLHDADVAADLGTAEGRAAAMEGVRSTSGGCLAGAVTCAGLAGSPTRAGSLLASVNYFGSIDLLTELRPLLVAGAEQAGGGATTSAVAISSNSTTVQPGIPTELIDVLLSHDEAGAREMADAVGSMATYPATKTAVAYWVRRQATGPEWAGSGVRLNAVAPGMIDTPMVGGMRDDPEVGPMLDMLPIPIGRPGKPDEIAALVALLLSTDGAFFCGSVLFCDGGSDALLRTTDWPKPWGISVRDMVTKVTT